MNAVIIILILFASLAVVVPLLEKYQHQLGLGKGMRLRKYIMPLVFVLLITQLLYVIFN